MNFLFHLSESQKSPLVNLQAIKKVKVAWRQIYKNFNENFSHCSEIEPPIVS